MKCITVKQPWASLIVEGIKDIENRTWKLPEKYKGQRVLIHAGIKPWGKLKVDSCFSHILTEEQFDDVVCEKTMDGLYLDPCTFGAIIGSVKIVDCVINYPSIWAEKSIDIYDQFSLDRHEAIFNWVLANPINFPEPIPAKGKLSFWDYPNILAEPEEEGGELYCHCNIPVKEESQVLPMGGEFRCRYCGGKWYK